MFVYEKYSFRLFTPLLALIASIFLVNSQFIGGSLSIVLGAMLSFSYQGVKIDMEKGRYIKYDRFLWVKIGTWRDLPPPSYATIVRINLSSRRTIPSPLVLPEDKQGAKSFKVNLVVEGEVRYINICRGNLDNMTKVALRLGNYLNIRVLDFTTHDKKWIL